MARDRAKTIAALRRLAERPGTPEEGETARRLLEKLEADAPTTGPGTYPGGWTVADYDQIINQVLGHNYRQAMDDIMAEIMRLSMRPAPSAGRRATQASQRGPKAARPASEAAHSAPYPHVPTSQHPFASNVPFESAGQADPFVSQSGRPAPRESQHPPAAGSASPSRTCEQNPDTGLAGIVGDPNDP